MRVKVSVALILWLGIDDRPTSSITIPQLSITIFYIKTYLCHKHNPISAVSWEAIGYFDSLECTINKYWDIFKKHPHKSHLNEEEWWWYWTIHVIIFILFTLNKAPFFYISAPNSLYHNFLININAYSLNCVATLFMMANSSLRVRRSLLRGSLCSNSRVKPCCSCDTRMLSPLEPPAFSLAKEIRISFHS